MLTSIDDCFLRISGSFLEAQEFLEPLFFTRSHSAFRAESQLAMSGQVVESYCIGRSCLESAIYGLHISRRPELGEVWLRRHVNEDSLERARREFSFRGVLKTLSAVDQDLSSRIEKLYQHTIDYGGHPNERSVTSNTTMKRVEDEITVKQFYLQGDSLALELALKTAAQIGLGALLVFKHVFSNQFHDPDVESAMSQLRERL